MMIQTVIITLIKPFLKLPLLFTVTSLILLSPTSALSQPKKPSVKKSPTIMLAIPNPRGFPFWVRVRNFARVVGKNLEIDLQIVTFDGPENKRFHYTDRIEKEIKANGKPDFIVSMLWLNGHTNIFNLADHYKIPLITINGNFGQQDEVKLIPRKHHQYWYGHIAPDDFQAGFKLAEHIIKSHGNKPGNLIAIAGDPYSVPSLERLAGLNKALSNHPNIKLNKTIYTDWTSYSSKNQTLALIDKQPIDLIWTASDFIAQGAIKAVEQKQGNLQAMQIGSIDWNQEGINLIKSRQLDVSYGGHFIEAGIALILAFDTLNGHDFESDLGVQIKTEMNIMHHGNVTDIGNILDFAHWKNLDFKHLTKTYNKDLKNYQLNFKSLLQYKLKEP